MANQKRFNEYLVENNIAKIRLKYKSEWLWATIDFEDLQRLVDFGYRWYARYDHHIKGFYAQCNVYDNSKHKVISLYQFILNHFDGIQVDHINNDSLDNRKSNLRLASSSDNGKNRKNKNVNNKSGYRNVSTIKGQYVVQLQIDGKNTVLGKFDDVDIAGKFAEAMREKYYGEFAGNS